MIPGSQLLPGMMTLACGIARESGTGCQDPKYPPIPVLGHYYQRSLKGTTGGQGTAGGSLTNQIKNPPARVLWRSTKAATEMKLELQLTAVGGQPTAVGLELMAVGCNRRR